jgi:hypothetical protein
MNRWVGMCEVYYGGYGEVLLPRYRVAYEVEAIAKGRER